MRKNVLWTLVGNVVYSACQWGLLVVIARLGTPEMVGRFALALAVTAPIVMFTNLQLASVQATDGADSYRFSEYRRLRAWGCVVAAIAIVIAGAISGRDAATWAVVAAVAISKLFEATSDIYYGLAQRHERLDRVAKSLVVRGTMSVVAVAVVLRTTGNLAAAVAAMALVWVAVLVWYDSHAPRYLPMRVPGEEPARPGAALSLAKLALPLGFTAALVSLAVNIPRYFVDHYLGKRALGIFSAMAYLIVAGRLVALPLALAAAPRLGNLLARGDRAGFRKLLTGLVIAGVAWGVAGIVVALVAGERAIVLLYGHDYAGNGETLVLLMIAAGFGYVSTFLQNGLTALRYTARQPMIIIASITASVTACVTLIPTHGLLGAGWALAIGSAVECAGSAIAIAIRGA